MKAGEDGGSKILFHNPKFSSEIQILGPKCVIRPIPRPIILRAV